MREDDDDDDDDDDDVNNSMYEFLLTTHLTTPTKHLASQNSILLACGNVSLDNAIRLAREAALILLPSDAASSRNNRVPRCNLAKSSKFVFH